MSTIISVLLAVFKAIAAIPQMLGYVQQFADEITLWRVQQMTTETLKMISDAAALSARSKTQEERLAAAKKWQEAFMRGRVYK